MEIQHLDESVGTVGESPTVPTDSFYNTPDIFKEGVVARSTKVSSTFTTGLDMEFLLIITIDPLCPLLNITHLLTKEPDTF